MFPAGIAGLALLIMRVASGAMMLQHICRLPALAAPVSFLILILLAGALFFGFLTPYASAVSCVIELTSMVRSGAQLKLLIAISIANTVALGILGPGAYSFDSHIFGGGLSTFLSGTSLKLPGKNRVSSLLRSSGYAAAVRKYRIWQPPEKAEMRSWISFEWRFRGGEPSSRLTPWMFVIGRPFFSNERSREFAMLLGHEDFLGGMHRYHRKPAFR